MTDDSRFERIINLGNIGLDSLGYPVCIKIEKLDEGVYLATSDSLQGLVAQGRTIAETVEIAKDVVSFRFWRIVWFTTFTTKHTKLTKNAQRRFRRFVSLNLKLCSYDYEPQRHRAHRDAQSSLLSALERNRIFAPD
jgi:hypothetical protein